MTPTEADDAEAGGPVAVKVVVDDARAEVDEADKSRLRMRESANLHFFFLRRVTTDEGSGGQS